MDFRTKVPRGTRVDDVTLDSIVRVDDVTLGSTRDSRDVTLVFMTSLSLALAFREFYPRIGSTWIKNTRGNEKNTRGNEKIRVEMKKL